MHTPDTRAWNCDKCSGGKQSAGRLDLVGVSGEVSEEPGGMKRVAQAENASEGERLHSPKDGPVTWVQKMKPER